MENLNGYGDGDEEEIGPPHGDGDGEENITTRIPRGESSWGSPYDITAGNPQRSTSSGDGGEAVDGAAEVRSKELRQGYRPAMAAERSTIAHSTARRAGCAEWRRGAGSESGGARIDQRGCACEAVRSDERRRRGTRHRSTTTTTSMRGRAARTTLDPRSLAVMTASACAQPKKNARGGRGRRSNGMAVADEIGESRR
ncbi:hypothetical protein Scep_027242 [Stephania cephalantha]|uniref:Uncharacterized protein n=1 Tax=Stephania cephalantha TaxID=152367 RepID=A0AAP0EA00_9MAGN